jgi:hypothetical protein
MNSARFASATRASFWNSSSTPFKTERPRNRSFSNTTRFLWPTPNSVIACYLRNPKQIKEYLAERERLAEKMNERFAADNGT